jgi:hypothetical protein
MTTPLPSVVYTSIMGRTVRVWKSLLVAAIVFSSSAAISSASKPVDVALSPAVGYAPLSARVRITIPPHPANRGFCLLVDSGDYGIADCRDHGPNDAVTTWVELKDLPEGEYIVLVELHRTGNDVITTPALHIKALEAFPK